GAADIMRGLNNPVQRVMAEDLSKLTDEQRRAHLAHVLKQGAAETNARLHHPLTHEQTRVRKLIALTVAAAIFAAFAILFRVVHRAYAPPPTTGIPRAPATRTTAVPTTARTAAPGATL